MADDRIESLAMNYSTSSPKWMRNALLAAGVYNILWGAFAVLAPNVMFDLLGMARPTYPQFWQCIGMIVGVYGLGYGIAAFDPVRHWPIVLVTFLAFQRALYIMPRHGIRPLLSSDRRRSRNSKCLF
ncbi:MAG: hypothetical protein ACI9R3_002931 [Verrucomicrobiales bacterium]|jgi:hypothetical protein